MKRFSKALGFTFIAASIFLAACSSPTISPATETPTQATLPTQAALPTQPPTNTPVATAAELPTSTALPTATTTPTQVPAASATATQIATEANTPTFQPVSPTALVNESTNCRSGPSADYALIVTFTSGDTATIVSNTSVPDYIVVGAPNNTLQTCWLWTKYVTISGDLSSLPVATPPPPLVNFTFDFTRVDTCGGYVMEFKIVNTGQKPLQAYSIEVKDLSTGSKVANSSATFDYMEECFIKKEIGWIDPGNVGYAYADNFSSIPSGHVFEAAITICSHNEMTGPCASQAVRFTP